MGHIRRPVTIALVIAIAPGAVCKKALGRYGLRAVFVGEIVAPEAPHKLKGAVWPVGLEVGVELDAGNEG